MALKCNIISGARESRASGELMINRYHGEDHGRDMRDCVSCLVNLVFIFAIRE